MSGASPRAAAMKRGTTLSIRTGTSPGSTTPQFTSTAIPCSTARKSVAADAASFFIAFNGWLADDEPRDLVELLQEMMDALGAGDGLATLAKSWGALVVG